MLSVAVKTAVFCLIELCYRAVLFPWLKHTVHLQEGNITVEGKVQSIERANILWDLRDVCFNVVILGLRLLTS